MKRDGKRLSRIVVGGGTLVVAAILLASLSGMSEGGEGSPADGRREEATPIPTTSPAGIPSPAPSVEPSTTITRSAPAADLERSLPEEEADILLYGTQTSALGVLRALLLSQERYPEPLTLVVISPSGTLESPLAQGLSVEDEYRPKRASGFYREFREAVLKEYRAQGIDPCLGSRLTYEPPVAARLLTELSGLDGLSSGEKRTRGARTLSYYQATLVSAEDEETPSVEVRLSDESTLRFRCRYLIDASVEADLARLLGCDYRLGTSSSVYNDREGKRPARPSSSNRYATAPQSLSLCVTLQVGSTTKAGQDQAGEGAGQLEGPWLLSAETCVRFAHSWSMSHPLPHGKRELNESWSDFRDPNACYEWFLFPERREGILKQLEDWTLSRVEELKERGYPELEIAHIPTYPYVRGELMVVGEDTYRLKDLKERVSREPIAVGCYALHDRHDVRTGSTQISNTAVARLPLGATRPQGHPRLLVSTAFSCEWRVYSSAVRMENLRANAGAAVGVVAVVAATGDTGVGEVTYEEVLTELRCQGHKIW